MDLDGETFEELPRRPPSARADQLERTGAFQPREGGPPGGGEAPGYRPLAPAPLAPPAPRGRAVDLADTLGGLLRAGNAVYMATEEPAGFEPWGPPAFSAETMAEAARVLGPDGAEEFERARALLARAGAAAPADGALLAGPALRFAGARDVRGAAALAGALPGGAAGFLLAEVGHRLAGGPGRAGAAEGRGEAREEGGEVGGAGGGQAPRGHFGGPPRLQGPAPDPAPRGYYSGPPRLQGPALERAAAVLRLAAEPGRFAAWAARRRQRAARKATRRARR